MEKTSQKGRKYKCNVLDNNYKKKTERQKLSKQDSEGERRERGGKEGCHKRKLASTFHQFSKS